jgi:hypothetical protein
MEITLSSGKVIKLSAKENNAVATWTPCGIGYTVKIQVVGGKSRSFRFFDSYYNMMEGKEVDLRGAIACFASDAITGENSDSAESIMEEFGYDKSEAKKVFTGVKKAQKQAEELGFSDEDLSELSDW